MQVGDTVERNTTELGYAGKKGVILEIKEGKARVQWKTNKTWYRIDRLKLSN